LVPYSFISSGSGKYGGSSTAEWHLSLLQSTFVSNDVQIAAITGSISLDVDDPSSLGTFYFNVEDVLNNNLQLKILDSLSWTFNSNLIELSGSSLYTKFQDNLWNLVTYFNINSIDSTSMIKILESSNNFQNLYFFATTSWDMTYGMINTLSGLLNLNGAKVFSFGSSWDAQLVGQSEPTATPSADPSFTPTASPTVVPGFPSESPVSNPTMDPTWMPSADPSFTPSAAPSFTPSTNPSFTPTVDPTFTPSTNPSFTPSTNPSFTPTVDPTFTPSANPTFTPSADPSFTPTASPTAGPTVVPGSPSESPVSNPTMDPTWMPSTDPSFTPSAAPSFTPSTNPSFTPTANPTASPTVVPGSPSESPVSNPTMDPTSKPTSNQTIKPTPLPTAAPTFASVTAVFEVVQTLEGITKSQWTEDVQNVFVKTVLEVIPVEDNEAQPTVIIKSPAIVTNTMSKMLRQMLQTTGSVDVDYTITFVNDIGTAEEEYNLISNELEESIHGGDFTVYLQENAATDGVVVLESVSSDSVNISPATYSGGDTTPNKYASLPVVAIIVAVVIVMIGGGSYMLYLKILEKKEKFDNWIKDETEDSNKEETKNPLYKGEKSNDNIITFEPNSTVNAGVSTVTKSGVIESHQKKDVLFAQNTECVHHKAAFDVDSNL
jgi:hypothetical protein